MWTLLASYLAFAFSGYLVRSDGFWKHLSVTSLSTPFADLRVVTAGWDCARHGLDVLRHNPCDPWHRPMNYPRVWTWGAHLGLGADATVPLAIILICAFVGSILWVSRSISVRCALLGSAVLLSPSVMLGVERANIDLFIFVLLLGYIGLLESTRVWQRRGALGLLLVTVIAKLYPIAAVAQLVLRRPGDRLWRAATGVAIASAIYGALTLHDLKLISLGTPRGTVLAYGSRVLWNGLSVGLGKAPVVAISGHTATILGALCVALMLAAAALVAVPVARRVEAEVPGTPKEHGAFVTGASVFMLTFALGNDYDYRLVFLLLTVPWLATLTTSARWWRWLGTLGAFLVVAEVWTGAFTTRLFPLDELCDYGLFLLLAVLLLVFSFRVLAPRWTAGTVGGGLTTGGLPAS